MPGAKNRRLGKFYLPNIGNCFEAKIGQTKKLFTQPRAFGDDLFELRPSGRSGIGRAFYCFMVVKRVTVLHAFIKKTPQTPDRELKLARLRLKEIKHG